MTDKSPIDILNEIHQMLTVLTAKVNIMDANINLLQDKVNGTLFSENKHPFKSESKQQIPTISMVQGNTSLVDALQKDQQKNIGIPLPEKQNKMAKVYGTIYGADKKQANGVHVVVKNEKDQLVAQLKTNRQGEWSTQLPAGKYNLTYTKEMMHPIYRVIEIKPGQEQLEVI